MVKPMTIIALLIAGFSVSGGAVVAGQADEGAAAPERHQEHRQRGRDFDGPGFLSERATELLGLDDAQSQQVKNILEAAKPEFDALRERGRELRQALMALDPADADYGAALQNLSVDSGQVATDITLLHGRVRSEVNAVLTPEQRSLLAERMQSFAARGWRGPRRGAR